MGYSKPLISSDKKVKILLIEDDERQINYAQQVLTGHELTVMRAWKELDDPSNLFRQFDLVITDLMLPKEQADGSKSDPHWNVGLHIYSAALLCLNLGGVKGVALVSNYEHHIDQDKREGGTWSYDQVRREIVGCQYRVYATIGKQIDWNWDGGQVVFRVSSSIDDPMNYLVVFDRPIWTMAQFFDQQGQVRLASEAPEDANIAQYVKEQGWSIIKPYKEVVDALLMDLQ